MRKFLQVGAVLILGALFALTFLLVQFPAERELSVAQRQYEQAKQRLEATTARGKDLENQAWALHRQVDRVELEVRQEYRMVKPGERILVIRDRGVAEGEEP